MCLKTKLVLNSEFVNLSLYDQLHQYLSVRPSINGSFFCHFNHEKIITRYQVTVILISALRFLCYNENDYNTHSFRIKAATHAAKMGKSDDEIMTMGRWKSDSYKRYKNRRNNLIHLKRVGNSLVISELPLSRYIWILGSSITLHAEKHQVQVYRTQIRITSTGIFSFIGRYFWYALG